MVYSDAHFIAITDGDVALCNGYDYIVHRTNLSDYKLIVQYIQDVLRKLNDTRKIDLIEEQLRKIDRLLGMPQTYKRQHSPLDFLDSALKLIAGTPDHNELEVKIGRGNINQK